MTGDREPATVTDEISATTRVAAVIGSPIGHSLSPALHNAAFRAANRDWRMVAFEVRAGGGAAAVAAATALGIGGLSVTTPLKSEVAAAVDEVDAAASALRSVNTVVVRPDGSTLGASTDGAGLVDSLGAAGVALAGARVVVLGAGGAARSIVDALGRCGVADLVVVNRTHEAAEHAARLATVARVGGVDEVADADVLVNATSVGMGSDDSPLAAHHLHARLAVADIVYHPLRTRLLADAEAAGARAVVDGLGMLVHQAARQQLLWAGADPDPRLRRPAAEAALAARSDR
jgi:shikimate dehydrogenase